MERVKTDVEGLDEILHGGIPKHQNSLISGSAGTGKTILTCQFLYNGVKDYDERGLFISLEEPIGKVKKEMKAFGFDFDELEEDMVDFLKITTFELGDIVDKIRQEVEMSKAERVVIDSLTRLCMVYEAEAMRREKISEIIEILRKNGCTSLLTSESPFEKEKAVSRYSISEFVADGIILLRYSKTNSSRSRTIEVLKMRGSSHSEKVHPFEITENGLIVYPKEEAF